ncbi:MAG TPA: TetR family transcriptional regulator [Trebonia sp.]|jgi:AcrR family transcriptional regulator
MTSATQGQGRTRGQGRGRPATVSAGELARAALTLWDQRGYENVAMSEVAAAAGVNERTLFRYFASKSDIVWGAIGTSFTDLRRQLARTPEHETLITRIRLGVLASFGLEEDPDVTRLRLRIISRTAELHSSTSLPFTSWRAVIEEFATRHLRADAADLTPRVAATCVQAATMSALIWWGTQDDGTPAEAVDRALRELESGFAQRPAPG